MCCYGLVRESRLLRVDKGEAAAEVDCLNRQMLIFQKFCFYLKGKASEVNLQEIATKGNFHTLSYRQERG